MAFSDSWDETSPNGAVVAADTLDTIVKNEVKRAIRERMESLRSEERRVGKEC